MVQIAGLRLIYDIRNIKIGKPHIVEIIVNQSEFTPYCFISIQILFLKEELNDRIYVWYDKEGTI